MPSWAPWPLGTKPAARAVHPHGPIPFLAADVERVIALHDGGIVDQQVDTGEIGDCLVDCTDQVYFALHVTDLGEDPTPKLLCCVDHLCQRLTSRNVTVDVTECARDGHHRRAGAGKRQGVGTPDPRARPRDDGHLARQIGRTIVCAHTIS